MGLKIKQATIEINEIKKLIEIKEKTKSMYLKNDLSKNIRFRLGELRYYCQNKKIDYNDLLEELQCQEKKS